MTNLGITEHRIKEKISLEEVKSFVQRIFSNEKI